MIDISMGCIIQGTLEIAMLMVNEILIAIILNVSLLSHYFPVSCAGQMLSVKLLIH